MLMSTQVEGGIPPENRPACVEEAESLVSPVPESVNVGLEAAFETKTREELRAPPPVGVKVTVSVCDAPGESVNEVGLTAKELLLLVMFVTVRATLPEFVTVSVCEVELPRLRVPNACEDCGREITAEPVPVPVRLMRDGLPLASCVTERVAPYVRAAAGVNVTVTVCAPPPEAMKKLPGIAANAASLLVMFETFSVAVPELLTVNVFWALVPVLTVPNVSDEAETAIVGTAATGVKLTIEPLCVTKLFCPTTRK